MLLTPSNLAHDLIRRGLLSAASILDGDFTVIEAGRRNSNFKVLRKSGPALFVKQVRTQSAELISTHGREAAFYEAVRSRPALQTVARILPKLLDYNPLNHTLVVELLPAAENLVEHHWRTGIWPEKIGALMGESLGLCHAHAGAFVSDPGVLAIFPRQLPFLLNLDPVSLFPLSSASPIGPELTAALRADGEILRHLQALRQEWQLDALIHGDMKLDNCVVFPGAGGMDFRIVDWELADIGDASWDIGSILASYLAYWIFTTPMQPGLPTPTDTLSRQAAMQPMLRAFWTSYTAARGLYPPAARQYLHRCLRFCAARLVVSVFEYMHNATTLTPNATAALQVSHNIFMMPEQGSRDVLGMDLS